MENESTTIARGASAGTNALLANTTGSPQLQGDGTEPDLVALVASLTTAEKVSLLVGATAWTTTPIPRIGLGAIHLSDGPVGVRGAGTSAEVTSAMMPAPSALAATWDVDLAARTGELFATEARRHDVHVVLAPQVNLQRTPVAGRHFECYSEDPHLTGEIAVALVRAAQRQGVAMCAKHFVANDSETERTTHVARVDERTLREAYLAPFERLVTEAGVWVVMGAYNGVDDGTAVAPMLEHRRLLTGVLKEEWGFDGLVVSDWVATRSIVPAVRGGLDLQMPGPDGPWGARLLHSVAAGDVAEHELDDKVLRALRLAHRTGVLDRDRPERVATRATMPREDAARFLRKLAARSVVVLKDDDGLVPFDVDRLTTADRPWTVALIGPAASRPFLQGGGSSSVVPDRVTTPAAELRAALPAHVDLVVAEGARARLRPAELDVATLVTDPDSGEPGFRLELLDGDGLSLRTWTDQWTGWLRDVPSDAVTLRVTGLVRFRQQGTHQFAFGTVGAHVVRVDGVVISTSDVVANENVVLNSEWNHPQISTVAVDGPSTVRLAADLQVVHTVGYGSFVRCLFAHDRPGRSTVEELAEAEAIAAGADVNVVVVGTTEEVESEGFDRPDLELPGNQNELVRRVLAANPRTIVVVNAGAPVLLPWFDQAPTVLWAWLAGQEAGTALTDVLLGVTEPAGRLPWTLPSSAADVPVPHAVPRDGIVDYAERLDVGYRAWERTGRQPAAPFGHGLGWTTWEYGAADLADPTTIGRGSPRDHHVDVTVRNTGRRDGREVVQVYLEPDPDDPTGEPDADRPVRWLGGFGTVDVPAGASATVTVRIPARAMQIWEVASQQWREPAGGHRLRIGRSIRDLRLTLLVPGPHRDITTNKETPI